MNWGKSIIAAFLFFALFIGVLVFICMKQEVSLVSKDYYKDEINYQQQIERLNNAEHLESKPTISILDADVKVSFKKLDATIFPVPQANASTTVNNV